MAWPDTFEAVEDWAPGKTPDTDPILITADDMNYLRRLLVGQPWYNAKAYGLAGDGTTDNTLGWRALHALVKATGGGEIFFPPGDYLFDTTTTADGVAWVLDLTADNITLAGVPGKSRLFTTQAARLFYAFGAGRTQPLTDWTLNSYTGGFGTPAADPPTIYGLSGPVAKGATTLPPLTNPADAANFVGGDYIYIRTGQLTAVTGEDTEPDAELNVVVASNDVTGVITLQRPTVKPYVQEWYTSGTSGQTQKTDPGGGTMAPFGISNVTDRTITNVTLRNLVLDNGSADLALISGGQIDGLTIERCTALTGRSLHSMGGVRDLRVLDNDITVSGTGAAALVFGMATGCSYGYFERNRVASQRFSYFHLHEGTAVVTSRDNVIVCAPTVTLSEVLLSIRARAYDHHHTGNTFVGSGSTNVIIIGEDCDLDGCGGRVTDNRVFSDTDRPINCQVGGWVVTPNQVTGATRLGTATLQNVPAGPITPLVLETWVLDDRQTSAFGTVPREAIVIGRYLWVEEAFNSDGTDLLTFGHDADPDAFATSVDVSTTGWKDVTAGAAGPLAADVTGEAYYTPGGSEPTTGKALCILMYIPSLLEPA